MGVINISVNRVIISFIILLSIMFFWNLFELDYFGNSVEEALEKGTIDYTQILHQIDVTNGKVVIYINSEDSDGLMWGCGFLKKVLGGYKWVGGQSQLQDGDDEFSFYSIASLDYQEKTPFPMVYGIVQSNIKKVTLTNTEAEQVEKAQLVRKDGYQLWYSFIEKPEKKVVYKIELVNSKGEQKKFYEEVENDNMVKFFVKIIKKTTFFLNSIVFIIGAALLWWFLKRLQRF